MSVFHLVLGLVLLPLGVFMAVRREVVVARHRRRSEGRPGQAPAAYLVLGVLLALVGVSQVVEAFV